MLFIYKVVDAKIFGFCVENLAHSIHHLHRRVVGREMKIALAQTGQVPTSFIVVVLSKAAW